MSTVLIEIDPETLGQKMQALTAMQQRFVRAYCQLGPQRGSDAAIAAGYAPANAAQQANNLLRNPRIQEALEEEIGKALRGGVILASAVLMDIMSDPTHKDRLKAAKMVLEHARVLVPADQVIEVRHTVDEKKQLANIQAMAQKLGIDPRQLLGQYGVVIDAEFEDVTHQVQPGPVRQQALPQPAEDDPWTVYPEGQAG